MTACTQAGCDGTIASDGYCDTCGTKEATPAAVAAEVSAPAAASGARSSTLPPPPAAAVTGGGESGAGAVCTEAGCGGTIASDGYCDTCGTKPDTVSSTTAPATAAPATGPVPGAGVDGVDGAEHAAARASLAVGAVCGRGGCVGSIAADGYCDSCGLAA
ncbi:MAG: hypothetical protein OEV40_27915, partial [Acidimicrobiia bacterium]|nr:hypothetical protein [Acidimicrobiia bacterium]